MKELFTLLLGLCITIVITTLILRILDSRERLLKKFENGTWTERKKALRKLTDSIWNTEDNTVTEQRILQVLLKALKDRDWHVRQEAVRALHTPYVRRAIPLYRDYAIDALSDKSVGVRKAAAMVLGKLRPVHSVDALLNALRDESGLVRREAALALGNIPDIRVVVPLLDALGDHDASVQQGATAGLKKACSLVRVIVFGTHSDDSLDGDHTITNPDMSQLTVPLRRLNRIIIATESYNFHQVEQFLTYAVNYMGQHYLKKHLEVHLYGAPEHLHTNLRNSLSNLCKRVHAHET